MSMGYSQKNKERLRKEAREKYLILSKKKKIKSVNMLVKIIKIFLKKKKKKSVTIV